MLSLFKLSLNVISSQLFILHLLLVYTQINAQNDTNEVTNSTLNYTGTEPTTIQTLSDLTAAETEPTISQTLSDFTSANSEPTILETISELTSAESEPTIIHTLSEFTAVPSEPTIIHTLSDMTEAPTEPTIIQTVRDFTEAESEPTIVHTLSDLTSAPEEPTIIHTMNDMTSAPNEPTIIYTFSDLTSAPNEPTIIQTKSDLKAVSTEPTIIPTFPELTTPEPDPKIATVIDLLTPRIEPKIKTIKDFTKVWFIEPTIFRIKDFTPSYIPKTTTPTMTTPTPTTTTTTATTTTPTTPTTQTPLTTPTTMTTITTPTPTTPTISTKTTTSTTPSTITTPTVPVTTSTNCGYQQKYFLNKTTDKCEIRSHCGAQEDGRLECTKRRAKCFMDEYKDKGYYCECPKGLHNIGDTCTYLCEIPENIQKCNTDYYGFCVDDENDASITLHCDCYAGFYRKIPYNPQSKCEMATFTMQLSVIIRYSIESLKSVYYDMSVNSINFIAQQLNEAIQTETDKNLVISNSVVQIRKKLVDNDIIDVALVDCKNSDIGYAIFNCVLTLQLNKQLNQSYVESKITENCVKANISGDNAYCALDGDIYLKKVQTVKDFEPCTPSLNLCQNLSKYSVCKQETGSTQYQCLCPKGFRAIQGQTTSLGTSINSNQLKLEQCVDIDECLEKLNCTSVHQTCKNTIGSYECQCDDTYIPIDTNNDNSGCFYVCEGVNCGLHGNCVPKGKSEYHCQCNEGYSGDKCVTSDKEPFLSVVGIVIISVISGVLLICLVVLGFVCGLRNGNRKPANSKNEHNWQLNPSAPIEPNGNIATPNSIAVTRV